MISSVGSINFETNSNHPDNSLLVAKIRKILKLSEPLQTKNLTFTEVQNYYKKEYNTFKEINKRNTAKIYIVLDNVMNTDWPQGIAHIREIQNTFYNINGWNFIYSLDWEWIDNIPFDIFKLDWDVQNKWVRDILLKQIHQEPKDVQQLEVNLRYEAEQKLGPEIREKLLKDIAAWNKCIDDFENLAEIRYFSRMSLLNSALDSWQV